MNWTNFEFNSLDLIDYSNWLELDGIIEVP